MLLTKRIVSCILILVRWIQRFEIENARVAQLVEHDLAKVGAAGSSPVSRSLLTKRASDGCPFLLNRVLPDQVVRVSTFRSGRCLTASTGRWLLRSAPVRAEQTSTGRLASPFHSGRCLTASTGRWQRLALSLQTRLFEVFAPLQSA